jgi:type I restriction enzyme, R subunit
MPEDFDEATRVQMPALVHLTRLGYRYFRKILEEQAGVMYDPETNILLMFSRNNLLLLIQRKRKWHFKP